MKIKSTDWKLRLIQKTFDRHLHPSNLCSFFWLWLSAMLCYPLFLLAKPLIPLYSLTMYFWDCLDDSIYELKPPKVIANNRLKALKDGDYTYINFCADTLGFILTICLFGLILIALYVILVIIYKFWYIVLGLTILVLAYFMYHKLKKSDNKLVDVVKTTGRYFSAKKKNICPLIEYED